MAFMGVDESKLVGEILSKGSPLIDKLLVELKELLDKTLEEHKITIIIEKKSKENK